MRVRLLQLPSARPEEYQALEGSGGQAEEEHGRYDYHKAIQHPGKPLMEELGLG